MTRKRYVKLLMSHGVSRNRANELALHTCTKGDYENGYKMWCAVNDLKDPLAALGESIAKFSEALGRMASELCVAVGDFSAAFNKAMEENR